MSIIFRHPFFKLFNPLIYFDVSKMSEAIRVLWNTVVKKEAGAAWKLLCTQCTYIFTWNLSQWSFN